MEQCQSRLHICWNRIKVVLNRKKAFFCSNRSGKQLTSLLIAAMFLCIWCVGVHYFFSIVVDSMIKTHSKNTRHACIYV